MTSYANGKAPETALVKVDGIHVVPSIAPRVRAFIAYAKTQGHTIHIVALGGYCNLAEQGARIKAASSGSTISVAGVGESTHGIYAKGRVDLVGANGHSYTAAELKWIVDNAGKFGLIREFGTKDPNHFMESGEFASTGEQIPVAIGEIGMDKFLINRTGPSVVGLQVFDYSTKTYRNVSTKGEKFIVAEEEAAGRMAQYDVSDATMASDYGDWKPWVAPISDVAAISAAVTAAVTSAIAKVGVKVDDAAIAKAVDDAVADNFAAIPAAVVKAQGAALSNG